MKKALTIIFAAAAFVLLSSCAPSDNAPPETPNVLVPAIMHDGSVYCTTWKQMAGDVSESAIVGEIASVVSITQWPQQEGQANFEGALNAPCAIVDEGVVVLLENEWTLFELKTDE